MLTWLLFKKMYFFKYTGFCYLPPKIFEKVTRNVVSPCTNVWPNHVIGTFNSFTSVADFLKSLPNWKEKSLPKVYFARPDWLPKPVKRKVTVNMQQFIEDFVSWNGTIMRLKEIISNLRYWTPRLVIGNILWKGT